MYTFLCDTRIIINAKYVGLTKHTFQLLLYFFVLFADVIFPMIHMQILNHAYETTDAQLP